MKYEYTVLGVSEKKLPTVLAEHAQAGWRMVHLSPKSINGTTVGAYTIVMEREVTP